MTTLQAFQYLINHWQHLDRKFTTLHRYSKYQFLNGKYLSEDKMREILMAAPGFKHKPEKWSVPKFDSTKKS